MEERIMKKNERDNEITLAGEAAYLDAKRHGATEDEALNALVDAEKSAAALLGRKGGLAKSPRKTDASRANGEKGGRQPRL
jgi:hypothetical protein